MAKAKKESLTASLGELSGQQKQKSDIITIKPINFRRLAFHVIGTSPLLQCRFSQKSFDAIRETQAEGQAAKGKKKREPKDFVANRIAATHISRDGWYGHPASAFRNAAIDVCRTVGFQMTKAKMSLFIEADGLDKLEPTPLVRLDVGEPEHSEMVVRNATGVVDIRARPLWPEWEIKQLVVRYDADQFTANDVANLIERAGNQCGIGEGRAFSKNSNGIGMGFFTIRDRRAA